MKRLKKWLMPVLVCLCVAPVAFVLAGCNAVKPDTEMTLQEFNAAFDKSTTWAASLSTSIPNESEFWERNGTLSYTSIIMTSAGGAGGSNRVTTYAINGLGWYGSSVALGNSIESGSWQYEETLAVPPAQLADAGKTQVQSIINQLMDGTGSYKITGDTLFTYNGEGVCVGTITLISNLSIPQYVLDAVGQ